MKRSNYEKESLFLYNEEEKTATIYTCSLSLQRKLSELCISYPGQITQTADDGCGGLTYKLPKKWLKVIPPRILSPAQREVLERMNQKKG
jgi:hypothetical protein